MTRALLSCAVVLAAMAAAGAADAQAALAQPDAVSSQFTLQGGVRAGCRIGQPATPTATNATVGAVGPGSAEVSITRLVDDQGRSLGATIIVVLPATCNQAHKITLASPNGGLVSDAPAVAAGPFRSSLPYQVTVDWGATPSVWSSTDDPLDLAVGDAASGPVTLTIEIPAGGAPLSAGAYGDQLILEFGVTG